MRADTHQPEMRRHMETRQVRPRRRKARVSGLIDKHNLDGRRTLAFWLGSAIVIALVVLDAIPLNWAAQAFDLNDADSWLVTLILLAASIGAMAGLEATRHDARRHTALAAVMLTAYAGLVALRTSFLVTVAGEAIAAALLQAVVLSAISAGLVFLGSAVMARTRPLRLSRALAAARRARRAPARPAKRPGAGPRRSCDATWVCCTGSWSGSPCTQRCHRADPSRMGGRPGARPPCPVHTAVTAPTKPPLDRPKRRQVGEAVPCGTSLVDPGLGRGRRPGDAGRSSRRAGRRGEPESSPRVSS